MSRAEFMRQLEDLLQEISPAEREEALQYYNGYFDDAGPEREAEVLETLGAPDRVAESIKRDLNGTVPAENIYNRMGSNRNPVVEYRETEQSGSAEPEKEEKEGLPTWAVVLIVILCILASPVLLSLGAAAFSVLLGLLIAWFGIVLAFGIVSVTLFAVLIVLLIVGCMSMLLSPWAGIAMIGIGLFAAGIGLLFLMLTVALAGIVTPVVIRGIGKLFRLIFGKNKKKGAAA